MVRGLLDTARPEERTATRIERSLFASRRVPASS
jgi:hypothetical protein